METYYISQMFLKSRNLIKYTEYENVGIYVVVRDH